MPQIFIEYKPLVGEDPFIKHWQKCRALHMKVGLVLNSELYKIREGLFLGMIDFNKVVAAVEPADYYRYAIDSMNGKGMRKSYLAAYFWAILAQANGDRRTASIMTKIEALGTNKELADTLDCNGQLAQAQADALMVWMDRN